TGTIVSVGQEWAFVDVGSKTEGSISVEELRGEDGELAVQAGDTLTAYVVKARDGEILLSKRMTSAASDQALEDAHRSGIPVEGIVQGERKGGYTVSIFGRDAFCPHSQIDLRSRGNPEDYLNKRFTFRVTEHSERGRNVVVSRRLILEEERQVQVVALKETLSQGDVVEGTVRNLAHFGAFVDIGGIEALVPISELAWYRVQEPGDVVQPGDRIKVRLIQLDWANQRIAASLKQTTEDPWDTVAERFAEEVVLLGTVKKLMNFGAFVELEPGVEGLVHISAFGTGRRINHPKEVVSEGEQVEVRVLSVKQDARRIGLELVWTGEAEEGEEPVELEVGKVISGTIDSVMEYGVFVNLPGRRTGLLHVSQVSESQKGDLRKRFVPGNPIDVEVLSVDEANNRISLSTKSLLQKAEQAEFKKFSTGGKATSSSFGTFGDLLKDKLKH
ncbi:S1 RNA-binding domain-containing protein, partial [Thermodesulfobacteriota bacterium]